MIGGQNINRNTADKNLEDTPMGSHPTSSHVALSSIGKYNDGVDENFVALLKSQIKDRDSYITQLQHEV